MANPIVAIMATLTASKSAVKRAREKEEEKIAIEALGEPDHYGQREFVDGHCYRVDFERKCGQIELYWVKEN